MADDATLRRRVAVKVLQPALALDQAFLRRFRAEAQAAAALNHPNIMRVFDWGEDDEGPFLVMEFLGGGSLRDMLDSGRRLSLSQAVLVGLEAARALDYAHRRGLVHRDIKPANISFDEEGRAAVTDFGLARALAEAAWTEPDGVLLGTARYAAPEAAQGRNVDGKADVYALGWVLLEAVTGEPPPVADTTVATLMARASQPIVAPFGLGPLGPVIDAAGALDPDDRPDAAALAVMLDAAARQLDAPAPLVLTPVLNLDARTPSAADPTEMGGTAAVSTVAVPVVGDDEPEPPRRRSRIPRVVGALVVVAALVAGGLLLIPKALAPTHIVPSLVSHTEHYADSANRPLHFKLAITRVYDDNSAAGTVIAQDPRPAAKLKEHQTLHLTVSKGPTPTAVPPIDGKTEDVARQLLDGSFTIDENVERPYNEDVPKGTVLSHTPPGDQLPKGTQIHLVVSNGAQPRKISDWTNKPFADAKSGIEAAGLHVKRVDGYSDTVAQGNVIGTSPGAGAEVAKGGTVTVTVCAGTLTVTVPDVIGKTVADATVAIQQAGLVVGQVQSFGNPNKGHVQYQSPQRGAKVNRGSSVNLLVN